MSQNLPSGSESIRSRRPTWRAILLLALAVLVGSLTFGVWAWAQSSLTAVPRLVPYQGNLERNGALVDVPADMAFSLYSSATGGTALWREAHAGVPVNSGRFTVMLGNETRIPLEVLNAPEIYLEVEVDGSVLQGRQRFLANPAAVAASHSVPPGAIVAFGGGSAPAGWLLCDGSEVSRSEFATLFQAIGTAHGAGNGTTTFNLPDYRARFLRGVAAGSARDPDRTARSTSMPGGNVGDSVGSVQGYATALARNALGTSSDGAHTHDYPDNSGWSSCNTPANVDCTAGESGFRSDVARTTTSAPSHGHTVDRGGDAETRPENAYVNWIIKY